ncbi:prepilin peptidase [Streptomyces sp. NPDC055078]
MYVTLIAVAALWGAATGALVPRAAYRLAVEPEENWRDACPAGHPYGGGARGWLGGARCGACTRERRVPAAGEGPARTPAAEEGPVRTPPGEEPTRTSAAEEGAVPTPAGEGATRAPVAVPLVTALVCAALAAATGPRPELAVWLLLTPVGVLLAEVDRRVHRLPDRLTLPLACAAAVLLGAAAALPGAAGSWTTALAGGLALGAAYFLLFVIHPNGMGFGDVKLALALGVALGWYGWGVLLAGAFAGFLFGSLYGFGLMAVGRANRKTAIPFGPFMIVGAFAGLVLGALTVAGGTAP